MIKKCINCGELKEHHAKGLCYSCYKKISWKPKKQICKRCKRELPLHAKGLCAGCYNFVFHSNKTKKDNHEKWHSISQELYNKKTKKCCICGFNKIVELHHLDENKKNNNENNLVGLCPNHHKMLHNFKFRKKIIQKLKNNCFSIPHDPKLDFNLNN